MIVRMGRFQKRPDLGVQRFAAIGGKAMGQLRASSKGLGVIIRTTSSIKNNSASDTMRGKIDFDGISQLWFDDVQSILRGSAVST